MSSKVIFHIDMNCFFLSCELINHPEYIGTPCAVSHIHGVKNVGSSMILSASYEARKYGVHAAMLNNEALKVCPNLKLLDSHYDLYERVSEKIMSYFFTLTPLVEIGSIDEAYLDVTDCVKDNNYLGFAEYIQKYLLDNLKIPCSIGIGPNKFLAKMGSDYKKPLGITVIRKRDVKKMLYPLKIGDLFGCGKKTEQLFKYLGINTIGDLANFNHKDTLLDLIGKNSFEYYMEKVEGNGSDIVIPTGDPIYESMSHDCTFEEHIKDSKVAYQELKKLCDVVSNRLIEYEHLAKSVNIKIKYDDFKVTSRQKSLIEATNDVNVIFNASKDLFNEYYDGVTPIRMLSVGVSKLVDINLGIKQLSLFDNLEKEEKDLEIKHIISNINSDLGSEVLRLGARKLKK